MISAPCVLKESFGIDYVGGFRCMAMEYLKASTERTERKGCNTDLEASACQGERGLVFDKS